MIEGNILPVPPSDFCKRLHEFDPNLQLNWDGKQGAWSLWYRSSDTGEINHVMTVVNADGSYRPLDERVFHILRANRFFAANPKELERKIIDSIISEREYQQKFVHDEMRHLSKDRTLRHKFDKIVDEARSIPWEDWQKPMKIMDESGNFIFNKEGQPLTYQPHHSLFENGGKKPAYIEEIYK